MTSINIPIQFIENRVEIPIANNNANLGGNHIDIPEFENGEWLILHEQYVNHLLFPL